MIAYVHSFVVLPGYAPGTYGFLVGYAAMKLTADALKRAGPNFTMQDFINAIDSKTNFDTGGMWPPITYTKTNHTAVPYVNIFQWYNGQLQTLVSGAGS